MTGSHEPGRELRLTLYTKPDCELCHEAKATLLALSQELAFDVVEIDITTDAALYDAFRTEIPVGFLDGRKLFKYRVDPALLRRQLARRQGGLLSRWSSPFRRRLS
jgi:glutaredoxin